MHILGLLLEAGGEYGFLPWLRGGTAAIVGISMVVVGGGSGLFFASITSKSQRYGSLLTVLAWTGGALFFLGLFIAIMRIFGEPCENWVPGPGGAGGAGGYCAD